MIGIYMITNTITNKKYIGQSIDIEKRWRTHKKKSTWKSQPNNYLYRAMNKYGIDKFKFEILCECNEDELNDLEIEYIKQYDTFENGYNETPGGSCYKMTDEMKRKISEANKGEKNGMYGKHPSDSTIEYMKNVLKGHPVTQNTRRKISEANKGEKNGMYGRTHTESAKQKLREYNTGRHHSEQTKKYLHDINIGKTIPAEQRARISNTLKGRKPPKFRWMNENGKEIIMSKGMANHFHPNWILISEYPV